MAQPNPAAKAVPAAPVKRTIRAKNPEKAEVKMLSANGKEQLTWKAEKNKAGKFVSFGYHNVIGADGKKLPGKGRGATVVSPDFAACKAALDAAVKQSLTKGWVKRVNTRSAEDAFDLASIPAPVA